MYSMIKEMCRKRFIIIVNVNFNTNIIIVVVVVVAVVTEVCSNLFEKKLMLILLNSKMGLISSLIVKIAKIY